MVMMMGAAALAVGGLAILAHENIDISIRCQRLKRSIDRGEPDGHALLGEFGVDLLRGPELR